MAETLAASGGFVAPRYPANTGVPFSLAAMRITRAFDSLPPYTATRGGIDFRPPHVRWAVARERELRAGARMWDWPRPPS